MSRKRITNTLDNAASLYRRLTEFTEPHDSPEESSELDQVALDIHNIAAEVKEELNDVASLFSKVDKQGTEDIWENLYNFLIHVPHRINAIAIGVQDEKRQEDLRGITKKIITSQSSLTAHDYEVSDINDIDDVLEVLSGLLNVGLDMKASKRIYEIVKKSMAVKFPVKKENANKGVFGRKLSDEETMRATRVLVEARFQYVGNFINDPDFVEEYDEEMLKHIMQLLNETLSNLKVLKKEKSIDDEFFQGMDKKVNSIMKSLILKFYIISGDEDIAEDNIGLWEEWSENPNLHMIVVLIEQMKLYCFENLKKTADDIKGFLESGTHEMSLSSDLQDIFKRLKKCENPEFLLNAQKEIEVIIYDFVKNMMDFIDQIDLYDHNYFNYYHKKNSIMKYLKNILNILMQNGIISNYITLSIIRVNAAIGINSPIDFIESKKSLQNALDNFTGKENVEESILKNYIMGLLEIEMMEMYILEDEDNEILDIESYNEHLVAVKKCITSLQKLERKLSNDGENNPDIIPLNIDVPQSSDLDDDNLSQILHAKLDKVLRKSNNTGE
jgi:hypothetical protein